MTTRQIEQRLQRRRRELIARYHDELDRASEELESDPSEEVEKATEQWDARVLTLLGDADATALSRIVAALRRLEAGRYGECVECGGRIASARLEVLPEAATCLDCAAAAERSHRASA